jgi:phospholipid/cholesterol/gamma-HCH transport system ATP-binding protein
MSAAATTGQGVAVQVRGLRKSFGTQPVLQGIDLDIRAGEVFVVMGPSGSGKSVLLRHLVGLEQPDAGQIQIDGRPIDGAGIQDRCRWAMVFQSSALLNSLSVGENVGLYLAEHRLKPPAEIRRVVAEKLELVGLAGLEEKSPSELSGGMKKRVAIARALVIDPQLILFDEPTSELDPLSAVAVAREILRLKQRLHVTSVVVTHDRDLAFGVADRIAMIHAGRILLVGTPDELRRSSEPLVRRFLSAEFSPSSAESAAP